MDTTSANLASERPSGGFAPVGRSGFGGRVKPLAVAVAAMLAVAAVQVVEPPEASAQSASHFGTVKACSGYNLQETCETFTVSAPDLRSSAVGNDRISSVRVEAGSRVVLWEHINYTGRCDVVDATSTWALDDMSLVGSVIGDDEVSSISFGDAYACSNPTAQARLGSATVSGEELHGDVADLTGTAVGNDAATHVQAIGWPVAVYSDANFEGSCVTIQPDALGSWLSFSPVGARRASSIALGHRCEKDVQLCEHDNFGGRCISLRSNKPRLSATDLGNDAASSLRVPDGWKVSLYEHDDYKGLFDAAPHPLWLFFNGYEDAHGGWGDIEKNFPVGVIGNDKLSSIKVEPPWACWQDLRCWSQPFPRFVREVVDKVEDNLP